MSFLGDIRSTITHFCYKHNLSEQNCLELLESLYDDAYADSREYDLIKAVSNDYDFYIKCEKELQLKNEILYTKKENI